MNKKQSLLFTLSLIILIFFNPVFYMPVTAVNATVSEEFLKDEGKSVDSITKEPASNGGSRLSASDSAIKDADSVFLRMVDENDESQDKEAVRKLQIALQASGYYQGCVVDGWFGPYTKKAVMEYQRDNHLPVTGFVDRHTYDSLIKKTFKKDRIFLHRTPHYDSSQDAGMVRALQVALQENGFYLDGSVDGWFGPVTQKAVMEYQRARNLKVTGTVDEELYKSLTGGDAGRTARSNEARGSGATSYGPEFQQYLKSTSGSPAANPKIQSIAASCKAGSPVETAKKVFQYVRNHISYSYYYNSGKGALGALSSGTANCCDQAHVVVSILRACGIPARYAHSTDCQFRSGLRCGHVWAMAYINGQWLPLDTTSPANSVGKNNSFTPYGGVKYYAELPF